MQRRRNSRGAVFGAMAALAMLSVTSLAAPAIAQVAAPAPVEQSNLSRDAFSTGTLSGAEGALANDLWRGADVDTLSFLLANAPAQPATPSLGDALRRALLSSGSAPEGAPASLGGQKLRALARAGFLNEARTLASLSSAPRNDPHVGEALAVIDLVSGDVQNACARNAALTSGRDAPFWVKLRVLCYAAAGERDAADLTLGLLRERGVLSDTDDVLLTALATGAAPKTPPAPRSALQFAAVKALNLPISPSLMSSADAAVVKAVAQDPDFDAATRIDAAMRAVAMGVMTAQDLSSAFSAVEFDVADLGDAANIARARPNDPLADVLLFRSVQQMTAPEFIRDKAARVAEALARADSFERAYALSTLYADQILALDGAIVAPSEAIAFARARMIVGDSASSARWLYASLGTGSIATLEEQNAMALIELTNQLALLDPIAAASVGEAADIAIAAPYARADTGAGSADDAEKMARVVEAAFDAAVDDIAGQAALSALAASSIASLGDPLGRVVIAQSLRAAGLEDIRRRMEIEAALRTQYRASAPTRSEDVAQPEASGGFAPSLKPDRL